MATKSEQSLDTGLDGRLLELLIAEHERLGEPRQRRLWDYYRNASGEASGISMRRRRYRLAQEQGLPARLTGLRGESAAVGPDGSEHEVVVENDIGWRVHTLVDFMFGKPFSLQSCAEEEGERETIERFLSEVMKANGGIGFFQELALLGSVYGYVDVLLRAVPAPVRPIDEQSRLTYRGGRGGTAKQATVEAGGALRRLLMAAREFVLEPIEAPKVIPVLNADDYRQVEAYVLHYRQALNAVASEGFMRRVKHRVLGGAVEGAQRAVVERTQVWTDRQVTLLEGESGRRRVVDQKVNRLGRIPMVHIQNLPQPFFYEGLSEVEPLVPLQDELNTRLSDRANRVTFQSFKMYLGKGIEKFTERPVGPGQMWATDNIDAKIETFGGDAESPSEEAHINEIREAMDKTSGVTPIAAGLLRNRVGNLTSESALRVVLMGLLAKTERKRVTYGTGIQRLCELILHAADVHGILTTRPEDRAVRIDWPSPLPENQYEDLRNAKLKLELGLPAKQVLSELGYGECA